MPNAKNIQPFENQNNMLVLGTTGTGKTTQFLTMPGKKFAYLFDPNSINTLAGHDLEYEEFLPDQLKVTVKSLSDKAKNKPRQTSLKTADIYIKWEEHFESALLDGFFKQFDSILLDSLTTFGDMVMDEVLRQNGREGQWPQQDDYGPQMNSIIKIMRVLTALKKKVYVTGHIELKEDDTSKRVFYQPMLTGRLRIKLPLLFSQIFVTTAEGSPQKKSVNYNIQTQPDRLHPDVRCTIKPVPKFFEDVSLDWDKPLEDQGIGGLMKQTWQQPAQEKRA